MILFFNPGHETAVKNGSPYYTPPTNIATMQTELSYLPAWYGDKNDLVLVADDTDRSYLDLLKQNMQDLPKAVYSSSLKLYAEEEVSFWGISPQAIKYLRELSIENEIELHIPEWRVEYNYLNSRLAARECLSILINGNSDIEQEILPEVYSDLDMVDWVANESGVRLLAKAPYSSSGRGLLWLPVGGLTRTERQILQGMFNKQGTITLEKVVDKVQDFAMEFICDGNGRVDFAGYSLFYTGNKGNYESNYIGAQSKIEKVLFSYISEELLETVKKELIEILKSKFAVFYKGCLGVDMMIYQRKGSYKLHPCLEINMRYNMGYLSLKLFEKYISTLSEGKFYLTYDNIVGEAYRKHQQMLELYPPHFSNGRLVQGYLSLCPVGTDSNYRAYVLIENS